MNDYIECTTCGKMVNAANRSCPACGAAIIAKTPAHTSVGAANKFADMCDAIEYLKLATVKVDCTDGNGEQSNGTAFFAEVDGEQYLITNYHVISAAYNTDGAITVTYPSEVNLRGSYEVEVIDVDPVNDVALLCPFDGMPDSVNFLSLANSDTIRQGESVITVGNPRGMEFNSLAGYVVNTEFCEDESQFTRVLCSMSAAPGNSGGAVARASDCSVIGIATEIFKPDYIVSHLICTTDKSIRGLIHTHNKKGNRK